MLALPENIRMIIEFIIYISILPVSGMVRTFMSEWFTQGHIRKEKTRRLQFKFKNSNSIQHRTIYNYLQHNIGIHPLHHIIYHFHHHYDWLWWKWSVMMKRMNCKNNHHQFYCNWKVKIKTWKTLIWTLFVYCLFYWICDISDR